MKFTTAFYTLALSFAAVTGSADARIGQKMSSDAFESRMMSGTQDDICRNGQICDPSAVTVCGVGKSNWCKSMECTYQTLSGEYRCQDGYNGRKLGGDPNNTPDSADARIGQQMSSDAFESRMLSGTQDCGDGCCLNEPCDPFSPTACGAGGPPPVHAGDPGCGYVACSDEYSVGKFYCSAG